MNRALKGFAIAISVVAGSLISAATESSWQMEPMKPDLNDEASLQRGLALYANFCIGCHSLQYQRYERTANDLGEIPEDLMLDFIIFSGQAIGDYMTTSMSQEDAKDWFGIAPPDLTMVTRVRSPKWVYNFLKTFYKDDSRPYGVNNKVFPNVAMPHVLLPLQGITEELCYGYQSIEILDRLEEFDEAAAEGEKESLDRMQGREPNCPEIRTLPGSGLYDEVQFDQAAFDIANFLHYVSDPTRQERKALGTYVLAFLFILLVLAYFLNREYWKDIHNRKSD